MKHIKPIPIPDEFDKLRFWRNVDKTTSSKGCWIWTGSRSPKGYGILTYQKKNVFAHRISFHLAGGVTTPEKPLVCHGPCHNPACVNPDHLEAGSCKKNIADKERDGTKRIGVDATNAKLDPDKVREIRDRFATGTISAIKLAREFGVHQSIILDVVHRRTWGHVDPDDPARIPAVFHKESTKGCANAAAKLTDNDVREIRRMRFAGSILREIASKFSLSISNVHDIVTRKHWAHIDPHEPLPAPGQYRRKT